MGRRQAPASINLLVVHCAATPNGRCFTSPAIDGTTSGQYWSGSTTEFSDWPGARGIGPIGGFGDWAQIVGVRRRNRGGRSYDDSPGDVLVVPFNDREAVFHSRGHIITDSSATQDDTILWAEDGDTYALPDPAPVCSQVAADSGCTRRAKSATRELIIRTSR